ncbi:MAG: RNA 2',3'-cyclic phosphodiesterase [Cellulomonas sp.]
MRLFVAVVPPTPVLDHLELALASVRGPQLPDDARSAVRWAPPDDRHLTLAFFGEVSAGVSEALADGLEEVAGERAPLELRLRGAGVFDRRIFWIGCGGDVAGLAALSAACVDVGREVTGRDDHRVRSRAHLTVARVRGASRGSSAADVSPLAHALAVYEGPSWRVDEIVLVSSRPGEGRGGGPAYERVTGFALNGVAGARP